MRSSKRVPAPSGGTVTALASKRGASDRVVVYLDGVRAFDVAALVADACRLRTGDRLTAQDVEQLLEKDAPYRAREAALRLVSFRDRSRHELESRLADAGYSPEAVTAAVTWMQDLGYLDDLKFASHYAAERLRGGWGERWIAAELTRLGVDREVVKQVLAEAASEALAAGGEALGADRVVELARRRFGRAFVEDPQAAARRLAAFLARRGFGWDRISEITRLLQQEAGVGGECTEEGWDGPLP